ncbi:laminin subunit alpha-1 [Polypterus senegalus]|uniref:laminin subunit alpha-1 n=1 Tax=Polypterus senegalus TaxID=55291 RepID=UPI00196512F9|nr:laminin subunit alpha-1 [Polypterus senegalus]
MKVACLIVLLWASAVKSQQKGLFPAILNLASNAKITTNATCGETGPEMFCKLVEHVPGRTIRNPQCRICDSYSSNPKERHPITNAIDGTNNWWQSPSIKNGRQYHWVTITLDLRQVFQLAYVIIKSANSPRPGNWILERSIDGIEFQPWQFYAISDTECLTRYNVTPRLGNPTYKYDDEVICTSYYSRLVPFEHGEIHTSLINGRPGADDLSPALLEFTSARYIRLRLQRIRTLNADLMTLSYRDPKDVDPIVTRRYFYSIKDISVGGMCICYGHAQSCPWDEATKKLQCICEHNTCGESCNECCPGYHQKPWQPGTISTGNTCEKCNCHNKTEDCYFDQSVADRNMSRNIFDQYEGGGVCINCTQNTAGINCETCIDGFYRAHKVSPYEMNPCAPCNCDPYGAEQSVCIRDDAEADLHIGLLPGQCQCKEGYDGVKCDRCSFGYSGYPHCVRCNCSLVGSTNTDPCAEECVCKNNVMGENCNLCKEGYYNLQKDNPDGCTECFCFGVSNVCETISWSRTQILHLSEWMLPVHQTDVRLDQYEVNNSILNNTKETSHLSSMYIWSAPEEFLGNKLSSYGGYLNYTIEYDALTENSKTILGFDFILEGNGRALHTGYTLETVPSYGVKTFEFVMLPESFIDWQKNTEERDKLMTVLANLSRLQAIAYSNFSSSGHLRIISVSLERASANAVNDRLALDVEHCKCPEGYTGTSCESCSSGYYRVDGILFGGICKQCECNGHASECNNHGVCFDCQDNTTGPHCEQCMPGYYGDASRGTTEDCQLCACPLETTTNNFSPTCYLDNSGGVICDQCLPGYDGSRCERCADGFYGDPTVPGQSCIPCDCNGNVNPVEPGRCDTQSGECLKCINNTAGRNCEICAEGYFGDAIVNKNCQACACHVNSSYSNICDLKSGQCQCKENVTGLKCDKCVPGHFGLSSGLGCQPCMCNLTGSLTEECSDDGQCHCVVGVAGEKCDRCAYGFYNFQDDGCTSCDCSHTHNTCNAKTGECICPPHTIGAKCEICQEDYWDHNSLTGCKACSCSTIGSVSSQCNLLSGHCHCKPGFGGDRCDECALGFRSFPECIACNCNINGTRQEFCNVKHGICSCEEETGKCVCKENVEGDRCNQCKPGTFALSVEDPFGCRPCFCFGVSEVCEELDGLVRIPISLNPDINILRVVSQSDLSGTEEGVFHHASDTLLDANLIRHSTLTEPYYWRLPDVFQGSKLLSYGGKLKYTLAFYALEGSGIYDFEPQVLIKGGRVGKLVIYHDLPPPENRVRTPQEIDLMEHKWKYFNSVSDWAVTHSDFMSVLGNIEYILIKASFGSGLQQSRISNISMDVAVDMDEISFDREVAHYIESCHCPSGYAGLSCQECAPGYHRQRLTEINVRGPRPFIEPCVPCQCNSHSKICDLDTGKCEGCQHNTVGDHCNLCAPGYYGKVNGSINDCSLCACPHGNVNSFSPTCILESNGDFRCNACMPGYEGQYCERCSEGYYGNPKEQNGICQLCTCNPAGSVHNYCDQLTGQCICKQGVRGRLCDECEVRHILMDTECVSCDDNCTGVLLSDLDNMMETLKAVNLTGVILAPYNLLASMENNTNELKTLIHPGLHPADLIAKEEEWMLEILEDINQLHNKTSQFSIDGKVLEKFTERTLNQSQEIQMFILKIQTAAEALVELANHLNDTLGSDVELTNSTQFQDEILQVLQFMRNKDFTQRHQIATNEFNAAEALLLQIQRELMKLWKETDELKTKISLTLSDHTSKLLDSQLLVYSAQNISVETIRLLKATSSNMEHINVKGQETINNERLAANTTEDVQALLSDAFNITEDVINGTSHLEEYIDEVEIWNPMLRKHVDNLVMNMSTRGVLDLVFKAEDHAAGLKKLAESLHNALEDVRNVSVNATTAVHANLNIKNNIEEAERNAEQANNTVAVVLDLVKSQFNEESLNDSGIQSLHRSSKFLNEAKNLNIKTDGLMNELNGLKEQVEEIRGNAENITRAFKKPLELINSLPKSNSSLFLDLKKSATGANSSVTAALQQLEGLNQQLESSSVTVAKARKTVNTTRDLFNESAKTANAAEKKVKEIEMQASLLFDRLKPLKMLEDNLSKNLSEIKELINQARKQAASIKVAVSANRDCVRSYKPEIASSNYNTLILTVKTSEPDNLLFYLGSSTNTDFMALETRKGKVSFLWDVGSGPVRLEYPDIHIDNDKWHSIHATRFGRTGSISVVDLKLSEKPAVKTASSPGISTVLDINNSTFVFVGGLSGQVQKPVAVKVTHFKGCMGEASLNGKNIGLWNYAQREGACRGCFITPQDEDTSFHFDGSGYSVVEKALYSTRTQLGMLFKTFSPNGLLLYLSSNGTRDFLSIELVDGKVKLTFDLGGGPLTLETDKRYNNGNWYKVAFHRNRKTGYLVVMDGSAANSTEQKQGVSPGTSSDLNRSDKDPIYIGGLPRSRPVRRPLISRSFVGCIKNLEISNSNFDLLKDSYGVRKGCVLEPIRSVSVLKNGFLELLPFPLSPESELMATFSTKNDTGVILAGITKSGNRKRRQTHLPFFAVMLIDGNVEIHMNSGEETTTKKVIIKSETGTFSDGQDHSIILHRNRRLVKVQVDEGNPSEFRLASSAESTPLLVTNLYLGGLPPGEATHLKTSRSFYGCIKNLGLNMELLDLTTAVKYQNVDLGSCLLEERPKITVQPDNEGLDSVVHPDPTQVLPVTESTLLESAMDQDLKETQLTKCAEEDIPGTVPSAYQFGLSANSHMVMPFDETTVKRKFSIQLTLRTFASSGLVYFMAHKNQMDYATLQLLDGQLYFIYDLGKGAAVVTLPDMINDGQWHTVKTDFAKKKATIAINGKESPPVGALGDGNSLDVEGKLYLGGLPLGYTIKKIGNVTSSIPACIRNIMLNNKPLTQDSATSGHAVGSCFSTAQEGSYFDGTGFAALVKEGYKVRSDVIISFEFRTTAENGVFLGISSAKVDAVGLELVNGKVLFHVNNGAGRLTAISKNADSSLCDGKWHKLQANKSKNRISLTIDGRTVHVANPHSHSTSADTNDPIYVGGYPGNVKQNCLTIQTPFKGCMRSLQLSKGQIREAFDLSMAYERHGVFPHSCPSLRV